ncbi:uncharacterized protein [Trachinotus anak]|uniref:uncharacterized protein n=1 Tax=Trachinotus anak TaxID=443729 RepID=UPI0039F1985F
MDYVDQLLSVCQTIYQMVENTKANKERCQRVSRRVKALEELVLTIKQRGPGQISAPVDKALKDLSITLHSAKDLIMKYSQTNVVKSFLKSGNLEEKFYMVNERLTDNFHILSGTLQVEQGNILYKVYESVVREDGEQPLTSPTAPMPHPPPTAPMLPPTPTASVPPTMPVSSPTALMPRPMPTGPMPLPIPVYRPITPAPVHCIVSPRPVTVPAATVPVRSIMSPMQVYSPPRPVPLTGTVARAPLSTAIVSQHVTTTVSPIALSPTTAPVAPMQFIRPAAPTTFSSQNTTVTNYIQSFLR